MEAVVITGLVVLVVVAVLFVIFHSRLAALETKMTTAVTSVTGSVEKIFAPGGMNEKVTTIHHEVVTKGLGLPPAPLK